MGIRYIYVYIRTYMLVLICSVAIYMYVLHSGLSVIVLYSVLSCWTVLNSMYVDLKSDNDICSHLRNCVHIFVYLYNYVSIHTEMYLTISCTYIRMYIVSPSSLTPVSCCGSLWNYHLRFCCFIYHACTWLYEWSRHSHQIACIPVLCTADSTCRFTNAFCE